jgi:hypothetical protein
MSQEVGKVHKPDFATCIPARVSQGHTMLQCANEYEIDQIDGLGNIPSQKWFYFGVKIQA